LALDSTKLDAAVASNFSDIANLFATTAKSTDSQVTFLGNTSKTQAGAYAINVTGFSPTTGTINGVAATGSGNNLVGAVGDASEGLNVKVTSGALGARGTINFSIGYAAQFDSLVTSLLNESGILASRTEGINNSIKRLDKQVESVTVRLTAIEARYRAQFTRLDTLMSSMSATSTFLTQQIASINANNK
jgi:flagellar hook-associated protein 2